MEKLATDIYTFENLRKKGFDLAKKRVIRIGIASSSEKRTIVEVKSVCGL